MKLEHKHLETKFETAENHELAHVEGGYMFAAGIVVGGVISAASTVITGHYANQVNIADYCADRL